MRTSGARARPKPFASRSLRGAGALLARGVSNAEDRQGAVHRARRRLKTHLQRCHPRLDVGTTVPPAVTVAIEARPAAVPDAEQLGFASGRDARGPRLEPRTYRVGSRLTSHVAVGLAFLLPQAFGGTSRS